MANKNTFSVEIVEHNFGEELTARERIMLKDTQNAVRLDKIVDPDSPMVIEFEHYAVIKVHNENGKVDKDYTQYIIIDKGGQKYVTGSVTFWNSFMDIYCEMGGEAFSIEVVKHPSKNFEGKYFMTASII